MKIHKSRCYYFEDIISQVPLNICLCGSKWRFFTFYTQNRFCTCTVGNIPQALIISWLGISGFDHPQVLNPPTLGEGPSGPSKPMTAGLQLGQEGFWDYRRMIAWGLWRIRMSKSFQKSNFRRNPCSQVWRVMVSSTSMDLLICVDSCNRTPVDNEGLLYKYHELLFQRLVNETGLGGNLWFIGQHFPTECDWCSTTTGTVF